MKPFTYLAPSELTDAVDAVSRHEESRIIAGGQSLLLEMKRRERSPRCLVSVNGIEELRGLSGRSDGLTIGAATTYARLEHSHLDGWHAELSRVAGNLADRPVRTMGTIGGALCQADPRFDMPTLAVGLDATLELISPAGIRRVAAVDFFDQDGETAGTDEILARVTLPALAHFTGAAFEKFRFRVFDAALASAMVAVRLDNTRRIEELRVAVGAVHPAPVLAGVAEDLVGRDTAAIAPDEVGHEVADEVIRPADRTNDLLRYQHELIAPLVRDALRRAIATPGS